MAESTSTLTYWELLTEVSDFLGTKRDPTGDDLDRVRAYVQAGYLQFLYPPGLPDPYNPNKRQNRHKWSWLEADTTLAITVAGGYDYDLPDNFGTLIGRFTYDAGVRNITIETTSAGRIRRLRAASDTDADPWAVAIRSTDFTNSTGQRYEAIFYPTPNASRTLYYRYRVRVDKLETPLTTGTAATISGANNDDLEMTGETFTTDGVAAGDYVILSNPSDSDMLHRLYTIESVDTQTGLTLVESVTANGTADYRVMPASLYHLGGSPYSQLLLESCIAIAELRGNDVRGDHSAFFMSLLEGAISEDLEAGPRNLGYNGDGSDGADYPRRANDDFTITYNGV